MTDHAAPVPGTKRERSLLAEIFVSPDEPRLRAGWRLLIHSLALLGLLFGVGVVVVFAGLMLGIVDFNFDPMAIIESPLLSTLAILLTVVLVTLVTWAARRFLDCRSFASLGLALERRTLPDLLFGFGLGGLLMGLIYAFESAMGWLAFEGWGWEMSGGWLIKALAAFLLYVGVGYYEELLSRGYHLQNLAAGLNLPLGLFLSAVIFSALHLFNPPGPSISSVLGLLAAGYFLAYGWVRTRQLWISIGLHTGWNFFQGTFFGFAVSGMGGFHLIEQTVDGPELITGGAFGPEAGLASLAAMVLGAGCIWLYTRNRAITQPGAE